MSVTNRDILEIMYLGHLINQQTDYTAFVDYSGHVEKLCVRVQENGEEIAQHNLYFSKDRLEASNEKVVKVKISLREYLLNTSLVDEVIESA